MADHEGFPIRELWEKYEEITMHFNDLIIRLRTQALAGVAAVCTENLKFDHSGDEVRQGWRVNE
jgi:hypothetical protein